jgi:hypothetical protein
MRDVTLSNLWFLVMTGGFSAAMCTRLQLRWRISAADGVAVRV